MVVSNVRFRFNQVLRKEIKCPVHLTRYEVRKDHFVVKASPLSQPNSPSSSLQEESILDVDSCLVHPVSVSNGVLQEDKNQGKKAEVFIVRTDGFSCTREMVDESGSLYFEGTSTHQHVLLWKTRPKCAMVIKRMGEALLEEFYSMVLYLADKENMEVVLEPDLYWKTRQKFPELICHFYTFHKYDCYRLGEVVDFIVCIGGDGVLLHAAHLFKQAVPPMVSFNLGSLSFLTNYEFGSFQKAISDMIYGTSDDSVDTSLCRIPNCFSNGVLVTLRMRLLCEIYRQGKTEPEHTYECLNEVVVDRGASPYLTNLECFENRRLITRVQADGIMLATPTGSTAYSVAAGGSMVHPHVPAILVTPICPHSLTFRPVILPDYADVELKVADCSRGNGWVSFDGRDRQVIERGDRVRVRMSPHPVPTVTRVDQTSDWFGSLERCFGWNERPEQQPIDNLQNNPK
eukprot:g2501.t1